MNRGVRISSTSPTDSQTDAQPQRGCPKCHATCIALVGLEDIIKANPRSRTPGLLVLAFVVVVMVSLTWWQFYSNQFGIGSLFGGYAGEVVFVAYILLLRCLLMRLVPIQMLVCLECKAVKATRWTHEKGLPMDWQLDISPTYICTKCGYSLLDLEVNRCPECGHPFPESWLKPNQTTGNEDTSRESRPPPIDASS